MTGTQTQQTEITYLEGDATDPVGEGQKLIIHVNNDKGGWGKGFAAALSQRWADPEAAYRQWFEHRDDPDWEPRFNLGAIWPVRVTPETMVINMIAQHDYAPHGEGPYIRYNSLWNCLMQVVPIVEMVSGSIHAPRLGCGLAGGEWSQVSKLLEQSFCMRGIPVYIYDLPGQPWEE